MLYGLEEYINYVEKNLSKIEFPITPSQLYDPIRYIIDIGGKRIRPALCLLSTEIFSKPFHNAINQAIAIEIFHNFTLLHDDIMDNSSMRRGKKTIHEKWNQNIAILSGDTMMIKSYEYLIMNAQDKTNQLLKCFNHMAIKVCEGQQMDMDFENQENVSIEKYEIMIRYKTAELIGCAMKIGAIMAEASSQDQEHIYNFGIYFGLAFQIYDDIIDLYSNKKKTGKKIGEDIINRKKTILMIEALNQINGTKKDFFLSILNNFELNDEDKIYKIKKIFDENKIKEIALKRLHLYLERSNNFIKLITSIDIDKNNQLTMLNKFLFNIV